MVIYHQRHAKRASTTVNFLIASILFPALTEQHHGKVQELSEG